MTKLSDDDRKLLSFFNETPDYQINTWAIRADAVPNMFSLGTDLQSLKRRGLLDAEGRSSNRQWWITDKGKEALA